MASNSFETDSDNVRIVDHEVGQDVKTYRTFDDDAAVQPPSPAAGSDPDATRNDNNQQNDESENETAPKHIGIQDDAEQPPPRTPELNQNVPRRQIQQNIDEANNIRPVPNENETERGNNQMKFVVLISIMLALVSMTFTQSLSPFMIRKYESPNPTSQEILIVYMLAGFLIIIVMFLFERKIKEQEGNPGAQQTIPDNRNHIGLSLKRIIRDKLSIVGMSFFFPFACILDLSHVITAFSCQETWRICGDEIYREYLVDLFYHLIRILFMGAELAICCKFHGTRFKAKVLVRFGLMIVMTANLGLWFLSLVYEASERDGHMNGEAKNCSNKSNHTMPENWESCVNATSSAHEVMNMMTRYLYPFAIEFALLAGEFLATKFVSHKNRDNVGSENTTQPSDLTASVRSITNSIRSAADDLTSGKLLTMIIISCGLFANFLFICLAFVGSFAHGRKKHEGDSHNWENVYEIYSVLYNILINVMLVIGYVCGYSLEIKKKTLTGFDWLVLISAFGPFMRELFAVTAIAASYTDLSPDDYPGVLISNRLATWLQLILQAPFIFLSERWRGQSDQSRHQCQKEILKAIVFCLAVTNLVNWIADSIILTNTFSIRNELMDRFVDVDNWKTMEHISLPLLVFYRFNSFLLFTRAYLGD